MMLDARHDSSDRQSSERHSSDQISTDRHGSDRPSILARAGRVAGAHPVWTVATWVMVAIVGFALAAGVVGPGLFSQLRSDDITVPGPAERVSDIVQADAATDARTTYVVIVEGADLSAPEAGPTALAAAKNLAAVPGVGSVATPWTAPGGFQGQGAALLEDGSPSSGGYAVSVSFDRGTTSEEFVAAVPQLDAELEPLIATTGSSRVQRGSGVQVFNAVSDQIADDLAVGEGIGLPITFVIMVVVFGGFIAAGLPIVGAIVSGAGALAALVGFAKVIDLDASVVNVVTMLGLALSIDYGLLLVSRYREELRAAVRGRPASDITRSERLAAMAATMDSAGRTVLFSGLTVAISMSGLLLFDSQLLKALGAAGVSVVLLSVVISLTLIPALCVASTSRLLRGNTDVSPAHGVFSRLAHAVQRAPWAVIAVVALVLVALSAPLAQQRLTSSGAELLPTDAPQRIWAQTLQDHYTELTEPEVVVVVPGDAATQDVQAWATNHVKSLPGVTAVSDVQKVAGDNEIVQIRTGDGGMGEKSRSVAASLRSDPQAPFEVWVGGPVAELDDFTDSSIERAPYAAALVVLASFVLIFLMTGSVVIPIKALIMNVMSLGASLGVVVWIFQDAHLESFLRFDSVGGVEQVVPIMAIAFGFGLAMDYEMFLLSRVVELHEQGRSTADAVAIGLQRSGRIITSAALIMIVVFAGLIVGKVLIIKETGVALVIAVAIDATLIRMLLVPATMTVMGRLNWWAPSWMQRAHQRFGIRA